MKSAHSRRPAMECFEQRQLMAADLAVADESLSLPADPSAHVLIQTLDADDAGQSSISNGLRPAMRVAIPNHATGEVSPLGMIIIEDSRPKDAEQLSLELSAEQLQIAVDHVFAEADSNSDSQLSDSEKEKWERLIHEAMLNLEERFEVRWQYVWGEGGLVTESFGPNDEWPV